MPIRAIGVRVAPKQITYAIVDRVTTGEFNVVDVSYIVVPPALHTPDQLRHVRTTFLEIVSEYGVRVAGLRLAETSSKNTDSFRIGLEAVLQESMASSPISQYFAGGLSSIARYLPGVALKDMKPLIEGDARFAISADWTVYQSEQRESLLAACAALSLQGVR